MGNELVKATGRSTLVIETKQGRRYIKEVLLVPRFDKNLLSIGQMILHVIFYLGKQMKMASKL